MSLRGLRFSVAAAIPGNISSCLSVKSYLTTALPLTGSPKGFTGLNLLDLRYEINSDGIRHCKKRCMDFVQMDVHGIGCKYAVTDGDGT